MAKKCVILKGSEKAFLCVLFDQNAQPVYAIADPVGISGIYPVTVSDADEKSIVKFIGEHFKIKSPETLFECIDFEEKKFITKHKMIFKNGLN